MPFKNLLEPDQRFYVIGLALILFACGSYFTDLSRVGLVTHDERWFQSEAATIRAGGVSRVIAESYRWATDQGRVGFLLSSFPLTGLYLLDAESRPAVITFVQIVAYISIALFLSLYLGPPAALLIFAFLLCFLTHPGRYYPDFAAPVAFHAAIALFFLGCTLQAAARRLRPGFWRRRLLVGVIFVFIFVSLSSYEALFVGCAIVEVAILWSVARVYARRGEPRAILKGLRSEAPVITAFAIYSFAYVVWRLLHPSTYGGNRLSDEPLRLWTVGRAVVTYAISSLPGANWFYGITKGARQLEMAQGGGWLGFLRRHFGLTECVLGVGIGATVWLYIRHGQVLWSGDGRRSASWPAVLEPAGSWQRRSLLVASIAIFTAFATQVPLALVPKYNRDPINLAPYGPSFFAFVCFCVGAAALLMAIAAGRGAFRSAVAAFCAAGAFVLCVASREVNTLAVAALESDYAPSRLMEAFIRSKVFASIPDGAIIVAPSLWETASLALPGDAEYWGGYVNLETGRHLQIRPTLPDRFVIPRAPGQMYYLEQQRLMGGDAALLLSQFYIRSGEEGLSGNSVTVISNRPLIDKAVIFEQSSYADRPPRVNAGILQAVALSSQYDGHVFVSSVPLPDGFIPGTAYVVSKDSALGRVKSTTLQVRPYEPMQYALSGKIRMEFGNGFSGLEISTDHYWHWSDGPSGTGEIIFWNGTDHSLDAVFTTCISTGRSSKLVFIFNGVSEVLSSRDACPIARQWTLAPGKNTLTIHSDAPRFPTLPGEARYVVFGVYDWKLNEPGAVIEEKSNEPMSYALSGKIRMEFGKGFSGLEMSADRYWHWSDGPSGTGEIILWNRSGGAANVAFEACVVSSPSRLVFGFNGRTEILSSQKVCPIARQWTLAPGKNTLSIHSEAPRLPTPPGEKRHIVFGVFDWKLRSIQ
jgi:hypothetical protein